MNQQRSRYRPWRVPVLIAFLLLLVAFIYLATDWASTPPVSETRLRIKQLTGLSLPATASGIQCFEQSLFVKWVFVKCDLSAEDVDTLIAQNPALPRLSEFRQDADLLDHMQTCGAQIAWWTLADDPCDLCASTETIKQQGNRHWTSAFEMCFGGTTDGNARVYIINWEEAVSAASTRPNE